MKRLRTRSCTGDFETKVKAEEKEGVWSSVLVVREGVLERESAGLCVMLGPLLGVSHVGGLRDYGAEC